MWCKNHTQLSAHTGIPAVSAAANSGQPHLSGGDPAVEQISSKAKRGEPVHRECLPLRRVAQDHQPLPLSAQLLQALHGPGQGVFAIFESQSVEGQQDRR